MRHPKIDNLISHYEVFMLCAENRGVKTGYTDGAGQVLVTSKEERGRTIITVVMASSDRFLDTKKLLDLIFDNITYLSIHP